MIVIGYFTGTTRVGMLAYAQEENGTRALGGFDPGNDEPANGKTVVNTDDTERVLAGWPHPNRLKEFGGPL